jgi:hypothetical protein
MLQKECRGDILSEDQKQLFHYYMTNKEDKVKLKILTVKRPTAMPYFFTEDPD